MSHINEFLIEIVSNIDLSVPLMKSLVVIMILSISEMYMFLLIMTQLVGRLITTKPHIITLWEI